jgi:hypothetical protein
MSLIFFHMLPKTDGDSEHIASCRNTAGNTIDVFGVFKVRKRSAGN